MKLRSRRWCLWLTALVTLAAAWANPAQAANPLDGKVQTAASGIGTPNLPATTNGPVGLDYNPVSNQFLVSLNYNTGNPNVFDTVNPNGTHAPFSTVAGLTTEIKIATVREASGGFTVGDTFYGVPGVGTAHSQIMRFPNGSSTPVLFATLPEGANFDVYPYKDTTGVFNGDLIVASSSGFVYRINSAGTITTIAQVPTTNQPDEPILEGLTVVPNDPKYGPWAGTAIIVSEQDHGFYAVSPAGISQANPNGVVAFYNLGINLPEDIRIVPCAQNLYITDFGANSILGISAADLEAAGVATPTQNHFIVDEEIASGNSSIWDVVYDPVAKAFTKRLLTVVPQAEQITFSQKGLGPVPDATLTITGTVTENGSPLNGVTVTLTDNLGNPIGTAITNASGVYSFTGLTPGGSFIVSVPNTLADGSTASQPNPVLLSNLIGCPLVTTVNFKYLPGTAISGKLLCTDNGSNMPLPNVTVTLTGTDINGVAVSKTTTTNANGEYSFPNLVPGSYTVTSPATTPSGFAITMAGANVFTTTLTANNPVTHNFAYTGVTITGHLFQDKNGDCILQPGTDINLSGVTVKLLDSNGNTVATTTTAADGSYKFFGCLPAGNYTVSVPTTVTQNGVTVTTSTPTQTTGNIVPGGSKNLDFCYTAPPSTAISGKLLCTDNGSNMPLPNVTVTLTGTDINGVAVSKTTTTNANGEYSFPNLVPGSYTVTSPATTPSGFAITMAGANVFTTTLTANNPVTHNFAYTGVTITGHLFQDQNGDCLYQPGTDIDLGGITVTLKDSNGNTVATTMTAADGSYKFFGCLPAGNYTVSVPTSVVKNGVTVTTSTPTQMTGSITPGGSKNLDFCYMTPPPPPGNGSTRTWGFYKTHLDFFTQVVNHHCINLGTLTCTKTQMPPLGGTQDLTNPSLAILEAIFATAPGKSTTALGQARLQLAHQLIAAEANVCMLGTSTASKGFDANLIAKAVAALDGQDTTLMGTLEGQLDSFNNSGDNINLPNGLQEGKADPKGAKNAADPNGPGCGFL